MGTETAIQWTDFSSNPIKFRRKSDGKQGFACVKFSPGCLNCYATRQNEWTGTGQPFSVAGMDEMDPYLDEKELNWLLKSKKISGKRVFIEDMSDLFGEWVLDEWLVRLFSVFTLRQDVIFQVLTKRAKRMYQFSQTGGELPNVWWMVSVENQAAANERIPWLLKIDRAKVRGLSVEPLLGAVNLIRIPYEPEGDRLTSDVGRQLFIDALRGYYQRSEQRAINWVIVGGESGSKARPMHPDWARSVRNQCQEAGVPFFFKQWGEYAPFDQLAWADDGTTFTHQPVELDGVMMCKVGKHKSGRVLDGRTWD